MIDQPGEVLTVDQESVLAVLDDLRNAAVARGHDGPAGCACFDGDQSEGFAAARRHDDDVGSAVDVFHVRAIPHVLYSGIVADLPAQAILGVGSGKPDWIAAFADDQKLDRLPMDGVRQPDEEVDALDVADLAEKADHHVMR